MARGSRPVYVISIAASIAGCHPRTLRIYEEEGLVEPVRTDSNIRLYSDEDLQRVRIIRYLTQQRGVNLAGVKMLLQFRDAADLLRELASAIDELDGAAVASDNRTVGPGSDRAPINTRTVGPGFAGPDRAPIKRKEANL
jgi:MerR family transcriptional regulator, heat shock protein HspR